MTRSLPSMWTGVSWRLLTGDCRETLRSLPECSVQTCITSPPYFGLRDYGTGEWEGGDPACDHLRPPNAKDPTSTLGTPGHMPGANTHQNHAREPWRAVCRKCGATRTDRQIGLEPTPDEFVAAMVAVFREVRRVLRDDGTVWLNLGDSYAARQFGWSNSNDRSWAAYHRENGDERPKAERAGHSMEGSHAFTRATGCKPKDLLMIPAQVALALRADGWYLRSDIIWAKPNPMPESVTDRPTSAHEHLFLLSKGPRYVYDADAIREAALWPDGPNSPQSIASPHGQGFTAGRSNGTPPMAGRNKRNVWTVATQPYSEAHFATFPPKLIEPCVLAGSSPKACGVCGAPWVRMTEVERRPTRPGTATKGNADRNDAGNPFRPEAISRTVGWESSCTHTDDDTGSSVVLDPFAGSGTTGVVALRHDRSFIGCELNPAYVEMARRRICDDAPLLNTFAEIVEEAA